MTLKKLLLLIPALLLCSCVSSTPMYVMEELYKNSAHCLSREGDTEEARINRILATPGLRGEVQYERCNAEYEMRSGRYALSTKDTAALIQLLRKNPCRGFLSIRPGYHVSLSEFQDANYRLISPKGEIIELRASSVGGVGTYIGKSYKTMESIVPHLKQLDAPTMLPFNRLKPIGD